MSKEFGIIRRIDNCGRVMIPKDMRRRYHIEDGDPIALSDAKDGIKVQKYSPLVDLGETALKVTASFAESMRVPVLLCDTYSVIMAKNIAGFDDKLISDSLYKAMLDGNETEVQIIKERETKVKAIAYIYAESNVVGALIIPDSTINMDDTKKKCLSICANAIGLMIF